MLLAHRLMPSTLRFIVQRLELRRHALAVCLPFDNKPTVPGPRAVMREPQEGECADPAFPTLLASQR